jgi:LytS/YehU family sensor histidine kinase
MPCYISAIACGALGAVIAGVFLQMENWLFLGFLSAVIGFVVTMMPLIVIDSTVSTLFVCFAEDSEALRRTQPALYDEFAQRGGMVHH